MFLQDVNLHFLLIQVVPSKVHLESIGHQLGKVLNYDDLVMDPDVNSAVLKQLSSHGAKRGLEKLDSKPFSQGFSWLFSY